MEFTGAIEAPNGSYERVSVQGNTYEESCEALTTSIPEGHKLLAIRTDR